MVMGMVILFFCFNRDQYVLYQRKRVGEVDDDRLKFEISTVLSRQVICFFFHLTFLLVNIQKFELFYFTVISWLCIARWFWDLTRDKCWQWCSYGKRNIKRIFNLVIITMSYLSNSFSCKLKLAHACQCFEKTSRLTFL